MLVAVLLVQLGSVTHAAWNLVSARVASDPRVFVWVYSAASLVLLAPVAVVIAVDDPDALSLRWAVGSGVSALMHIAYSIALQRSYAGADLNVAYPVSRGIGPVLVVVFAVTVLREHVDLEGWVGVLTIAVGVVVITTGSIDRVAHVRRLQGLRDGLVVAVTVAAYTLWDDHSVNGLRLQPVLYFAGTGLWMFLVLTAMTWSRRADAVMAARQHWRPALVVGVLSPVSYVLVLVAMTMAPVSLVAPLRSTSIVIGSLAAWLLFREPAGGRRLGGAALVTAGVLVMLV